MKIVHSENHGTGLVLRMFTSLGVKPNTYLGEKWVFPNEDGADTLGFTIIDAEPEFETNITDRSWISEFISMTLSDIDEDASKRAMNHLKWYFKALIESALYRYHISVNNDQYSEILFYQEIDKYIDKLISYGTSKMTKPEMR